MLYSDLKIVMSQEFSRYMNQLDINIKVGRQNPHENEISLSGQTYKILVNLTGDDTKDDLIKTEVQSLIKLFNKFTNSTVQFDYD